MNKKSTAPANSDAANLNKKYEAWFNANLKKCISLIKNDGPSM